MLRSDVNVFRKYLRFEEPLELVSGDSHNVLPPQTTRRYYRCFNS